jgi:integrase
MKKKRRPYGHGALYRKPGSKVWQIRYRGPRTTEHPKGDYRCSTHTANRGLASKMLAEHQRRWANLKVGVPGFIDPGSRKKTVAQLLAEVEKSAEVDRLKSLRQIKVHAKPVRRLLGHVLAITLTEPTRQKTINDYILARRAEKAADATIDRELELVGRGFELVGLQRPKKWRTKLVRKHANARPGFFERSEFEKLVAELPSDLLKDIARWGYCTGMRRGETLSLAWANYDRQTATIRLAARASKNGKPRVIPLSTYPELSAIIEHRRKARMPGCDLIFQNGRGARVGDFYTTWMRAAKRAKITRLTFHDLRRTAVRNMVAAGIDRATAKAISGHETDSIFERYQIIDEKNIADALAMRAAYEAGISGGSK